MSSTTTTAADEAGEADEVDEADEVWEVPKVKNLLRGLISNIVFPTRVSGMAIIT